MQKPSENLPQPESKWLTPKDFEFLCFDLAREAMDYNEPIPDYKTREDSLLESALGSPMQSFDGKLLYPTIIEQGSILFYSLIKNHPFENGNKRIGVMALLVFLSLNKKWLSVSPQDLYKVACDVSNSYTKDKEKSIADVEKLLSESIMPLPGSK